MKTVVTQGIVLARTNFGEADRIVTILTPDQGKIRVLAKGVRRPKSKLAGGIELFSIGDITYLPGRGELKTLISTRLSKYYENIVKDINRTMYGYELLKKINKISEDVVEEAYFELLKDGLEGLNSLEINLDMIDTWLIMHLLQLTGHAPNLQTDTEGHKLSVEGKYVFSFDDMVFAPTPQGEGVVNVVKVLRLAIATSNLAVFAKVQMDDAVMSQARQLAQTMEKYSLGL